MLDSAKHICTLTNKLASLLCCILVQQVRRGSVDLAFRGLNTLNKCSFLLQFHTSATERVQHRSELLYISTAHLPSRERTWPPSAQASCCCWGFHSIGGLVCALQCFMLNKRLASSCFSSAKQIKLHRAVYQHATLSGGLATSSAQKKLMNKHIALNLNM